MASISFLIGIIGNIISLLVFTSPIKTFWRVVKMKSTQNYKGAPYITTLLSTSLWTFYGLLKPAILIVTVNGAGAIFQFIYVTIFLVYATRDKKIKTARLVAILNVGFLGAVIAVTILAMHGGLRTTFVGVLCAAKTFWRVVKMKSTQNYKGAPYITTLLSTSLWTFYGLLKPAILIVTVNGAGAIFQLTYVTIFLVYATRDKKIKTARLVAILNVGFLGAVIAVTILAMHGGLRTTFVGVLCAALTIGMYAAPLSAMKIVIKTRSVEYMPFFLSFFLFLNGGVWSVYALLVKDYYIGVPNAFGFVLGSAQLILYMVYRKKAAAMIGEKGSVHIEAKDGVEIMPAKGDEEAGSLKNRSLAEEKTKSLPKPSVDRQHSLQNLTKTLSLGAYELLQHSSWANDAV